MNNSRVSKIVYNLTTGIIFQLITMVLNFISRTYFIRFLGVEYLGLNSLYTNILTILSLADLGINNVLMFSLYKPLHLKNFDRVVSIINYFKKVYLIIAFIIGALGLILIPFLDYIVNLDDKIHNYKLYYILILINTVSSYLYIYKSILISADQKKYILNNFNSVFILIKYSFLIMVLYIFNSFFLFLLIQNIYTIISNIIISSKANKLYPFIKNRSINLDKLEKKVISNNVKTMLMYKIGGVILNNTDNIIISILLGTVAVGYYSNYLIIVFTITGFTNILMSSLISSVGSLINNASKEYILKTFNSLNMFSGNLTW